MKRIFFAFFLILEGAFVLAQNNGFATAFEKFQADPQLKAAISSLYVVNAKTGAVVFERNSRIGLAPGSTQKIITSTAAYEILGRDFSYKTEFGIVQNGTETDLYIK